MVLEWLATVLEQKFGVKPEITNAGPIAEGSHGYMAQIQRVQLAWPSQRADLPASVVIKCPVAGSAADAWLEAGGDMTHEEKKFTVDENARRMKKVQEMCHTVESQVYALFDESCSNPAPLPMPTTYASFGVDHAHPAIVMEDITGATVTDIVTGWTEKQIYTILDSIVDLHVMSFTTDKWKSIKLEAVRKRYDKDLGDGFAIMANMFATEILKKCPLPSLEKVQKHVLSEVSWFMGMYEKYPSENPLSVLVHGDMWAPQFLWRGDELAAIVDWQLTHPGNIMEDLLRLVPLGASVADRTRLMPALLEHYYTQLTTKLTAKGHAVPFTKEEMKAEYKAILPYSCGMAVFAFGMWSNSPVLKKGDSEDDARIGEMFSRMAALMEECVQAYGW